MSDTAQGTTLIARRTAGTSETGATVGSYRCLDTGALVLTNVVDTPHSPLTGGEMARVNDKYSMSLDTDAFASLSPVGVCPNADCAAELYTQRKYRAEQAGSVCHCTACGTAFTAPPLSDEEADEFAREVTPAPATVAKAQGKPKGAEAADMGMSTGGPTSDANDQMGTNYLDDSSSSSDDDSDSSSSSDSSDDDWGGDTLLIDDSDSDGDGNGDASEYSDPDDSDDDPALAANSPADWAALAAGEGLKGSQPMAKTPYIAKSKSMPVTAPVPVSNNSPGGEPCPEGHDTLTPHAQTQPGTMPRPAAVVSNLDDSVMLLIHGLVAMAVEEDPAASAKFTSVGASLAGVSASKADLTGSEETNAAVCFELSLEQAGESVDTISDVLDVIEETQDDPASVTAAFARVADILKDKVSEPVLAAWNNLGAAIAVAESADVVPVAETVVPPTADAAPTVAPTPAAAPAVVPVAEIPANPAATNPDAVLTPAQSVGEAPVPPVVPATVAADEPVQLVNIDVSEIFDFDPRTLMVVPVTTGTLGVFANVDGHMEPIGTLIAAIASDENKSMFAENKLGLIRSALVASVESETGSPVDLGFHPIIAKIDTKLLGEREAAAVAETAASEVAAAAGEAVERHKQALQISLAGMTKGLFASPLADQIGFELKRRGVQNAGAIANRIVAASADEYMRAALAKAEEFAAMGDNELNAVAKMIAGAPMQPAEEATTDASFATASIPTPVAPVLNETAQIIQMPTPSVEPKNLFAGVGYGGAARG